MSGKPKEQALYNLPFAHDVLEPLGKPILTLSWVDVPLMHCTLLAGP